MCTFNSCSMTAECQVTVALYVAELKVKEVFRSGADNVLGIQINNSYISLPRELFNGSSGTT